MKEINAIIRIINKMGWQKMPARVALVAVRAAVMNHIACMQDCTGDEPTVLQALQDLNVLSADGVWLSLYVNDYQTLHDTEGKKFFLSLRWEMEECMHHGMTHAQAREEWDV